MKWENIHKSQLEYLIVVVGLLAIIWLNISTVRAAPVVQRVADLYPGATGSSPRFATEFNNKLYFAADGNDGAGRTLWMYDGVNLPSDVLSEMPNLTPNFITVFNNKLYFSGFGNDGSGVELWKYDGINSPIRVADINSGSGNSSPMSLAVFDNKLYFTANPTFNSGYQLWMYDGVNPPSLVAYLGGDYYNTSYVSYLTVYNNKLYFSADAQDGDGIVLWVYDGINLPSKAWIGGGNPDPASLTVFNGKLYFQAANENPGLPSRLLWVYDGINPPSHAVDVQFGTNYASVDSVYSMTVYNNQLYFQADGGDGAGFELWSYDGVNPASRVADIYSGSSSSYPSHLVEFNNILYFRADGGDGAGTELWSYYDDSVPWPGTITPSFTPLTTVTSNPTFTPSETGTLPPTETGTAYATSTPDCYQFFLYYGFTQLTTSGKPRVMFLIDNNSPQNTYIQSVFFNWDVYDAANPSQTLDGWRFNNFDIVTADDPDSPTTWYMSGPPSSQTLLMAGSASEFDFDYLNIDSAWQPGTIDGSFGLTVGLSNGCMVFIDVQPTPLPMPTMTLTWTPTITRTPTITNTPTVTKTPTITLTPSKTPTIPNPSFTPKPTITKTRTASSTPSKTPTITTTPTYTNTSKPTTTLTSTPITVTFSDVPSTYWAWSFIERLYHAGITGGCSTNPLMFCPETNVTRAQMAVFLLRGEHGSAYSPPAVGASTGFNDVPTTHWAAAWIKQLANEGITGGCGVGNYCPDMEVTRAQMAIFLLRAKHGSSYSPPPATGVFVDVPTTHWAAAWIEQLAAEGITGGCGNGNYCPDDVVTRAQMAVFLVKNFNLP